MEELEAEMKENGKGRSPANVIIIHVNCHKA